MPPKTTAKTEAGWEAHKKALLEQITEIRSHGTSKKSGSDFKGKMQWRTEIFNVLTADQTAARFYYNNMVSTIEGDLEENVVKPVGVLVKNQDEDGIFAFLAKAYREFQLIEKSAGFAFGYLDQYFTKEKQEIPVRDKLKMIFKARVYSKVKDDVRTVILRQIKAFRDGNVVSMTDLKAATQFFSQIGQIAGLKSSFDVDFESHFIVDTTRYFKEKSISQISENGSGGRTVVAYLRWVEKILAGEEALMRDLDLSDKCVRNLHHSMLNELVANQAKLILDDSTEGLGVLLNNNREEEASLMFRVISRIAGNKGMEIMRDAYERFTVRSIDLLFAEAEAEIEAEKVAKKKLSLHAEEKILGDLAFKAVEFYTAQRHITHTRFAKSDTLFSGLISGLRKSLNANSRPSPHALAVLFDNLMRRTFHDIATKPVEETNWIDCSVAVFDCLEAKDVFLGHCKTKLAKRLLSTKEFNADIERSVLTKLQALQGKSVIYALKVMISDVENGESLSRDFKASPLASRIPGAAQFNVKLLTANYWPSYREDPFLPPPSLAGYVAAFTQFYETSHTTATLSWRHYLGSAQASIAFDKQPKEVTGTIRQISVLSLVDEAGRLSMHDLEKQLGLDGRTTTSLIASLYMHKFFKMLDLVNPETGEVLPTRNTIKGSDTFQINRGYAFKQRKFTIEPERDGGLVEAKEPNVATFRTTQCDTAIIRIMKSQQTMKYTDLVERTVVLLSKYFKPPVALIKKQIESLMERNFLKRDEEDHRLFHYVA